MIKELVKRMASSSSWLERPVKGLLLDITGVLYNSGDGDGEAIQGSVEAIKRLQDSNISIRFCSNESTNVPAHLVEKLKRLGFSLSLDQVFTPLPATLQVLKERNLRPHLLIHNNALPVFDSIDKTNPNCVVMGDAQENFVYDKLNKAFELLIHSENPILITMGCGKYYMETDGLKLDVGAYSKALEFACDIKAEIVGKPSHSFFNAAIASMGLTKDSVVMIGDDIVSDVGGAQKSGIRGVQVRTGKWRDSWENHPTVKPDGIVDNLADAVNQLLTG